MLALVMRVPSSVNNCRKRVSYRSNRPVPNQLKFINSRFSCLVRLNMVSKRGISILLSISMPECMNSMFMRILS